MQKLTLTISTTLLFLTFQLLPNLSQAQRDYEIKTDPLNSRRKIVQMKPATRRMQTTDVRGNVLSIPRYQRPAIDFKPFEMRNPKTGKAINPNAQITIKSPDGKSQRTATAKQFFDELNELEKTLASKGRTLRVSATFSDLQPNFNPNNYNKPSIFTPGFKSVVFKTNSNPAATGLSATGTPQVSNNVQFTVNKNTFNTIAWESNLYIAEQYENTGTSEFPAEWANSSIMSAGRKIFPILIEAPKGFEKLIKRIEWQLSETPFDNTLKDVKPANVKKTGSVTQFTWGAHRGTDILPGFKNNTYTLILFNLAQEVGAPPATTYKPYYIRAVTYSASNDVLNITPQVIALYGNYQKPFKIAPTEYNTVPGFNYSFPAESSGIPFGVFIKGQGFTTNKTTRFTDENYENLVNNGFKVSGNASLGIRYFNFMSIISDNEPKSKELSLIKAGFTGVAGSGTGPGSTNEANGFALNLNILEGLYTPSINFTEKIPGTNTISLNYTVKQPLDIELLNARFFIGPVPIKIAAGIGGEAGVEISGQANPSTVDVSGSIRPYISSRFYASGGVDAIIAYATLNAEINPLLSIEMPVTFTTNGKGLTFSNTIKGLNGRVYLAVGFYYPCPSLEKIVGWLSGDEDLPLCECKWEYNIFDFKGFEETVTY